MSKSVSLWSVQDIAKITALPDFVKSAEIISTEDLPARAFADRERQYPVHTKAATWLSIAEFYRSGTKNEQIEALLEKSAAVWNISEDERLLVKADIEKAASVTPATDEEFAIVVKVAGTTVERIGQLTDAVSVKSAAEKLIAGRSRYPFEVRSQAAKRIIKAAKALGVTDLENLSYLEKAAGYGVGDTAVVAKNLLNRFHQSRNPQTVVFKEIADRLYKEASSSHTIPSVTLEKMAMAIDGIDRMSGLYKRYTRDVTTPEELLYTYSLSDLQEKRASFVSLVDGTVLQLAKFAGMRANQLSALGDDFVAAVQDEQGGIDMAKLAGVIPTLPADDAKILVNSLALA